MGEAPNNTSRSHAIATNRAGSGHVAGPHEDDRRADRQTYLWIAVLLIAFLVVDILSVMTENSRAGVSSDPSKFAIYEITSVAVILALLPVVSWATSRATPGRHSWRRVIAAHLAMAAAFSALHVAAMVLLRKAIFAVVYDHPYIFADNLARELVYEFRKDALVYVMLVFFITLGRELYQQRRELAAAREDAQTMRRVTLKCGGRSILIDASAVHWVKAASNYVEVATDGKTHLARSTLAGIEAQLRAAGAEAVRVHRSHLVNTTHIREIRPTGEGDVAIEMADGAVIPGSRRYRDRLRASAEGP